MLNDYKFLIEQAKTKEELSKIYYQAFLNNNKFQTEIFDLCIKKEMELKSEGS